MCHLVDKHRAHRLVNVVGIDYYPVHPTAWRLDASASYYMDVGGIVGAAVGTHGLDVAAAGMMQFFTGEMTQTITSQVIESMGVESETANAIDLGASGMLTLGIGATLSAFWGCAAFSGSDVFSGASAAFSGASAPLAEFWAASAAESFCAMSWSPRFCDFCDDATPAKTRSPIEATMSATMTAYER